MSVWKEKKCLLYLIPACASGFRTEEMLFETCFSLFNFWIPMPSPRCPCGVCGISLCPAPRSNPSVRCGPPDNVLSLNGPQLPGCCLRVGSIFAPCEISSLPSMWGKRSGRAAGLNARRLLMEFNPGYEGLRSKCCVSLPAIQVEMVTGK